MNLEKAEKVWISSDYVICNQEEILNIFSLRVIPTSEVILACNSDIF